MFDNYFQFPVTVPFPISNSISISSFLQMPAVLLSYKANTSASLHNCILSYWTVHYNTYEHAQE